MLVFRSIEIGSERSNRLDRPIFLNINEKCNDYLNLLILVKNKNLFLYVVLDRKRANLAMARHELKAFEKSLDFS